MYLCIMTAKYWCILLQQLLICVCDILYCVLTRNDTDITLCINYQTIIILTLAFGHITACKGLKSSCDLVENLLQSCCYIMLLCQHNWLTVQELQVFNDRFKNTNMWTNFKSSVDSTIILIGRTHDRIDFIAKGLDDVN